MFWHTQSAVLPALQHLGTDKINHLAELPVPLLLLLPFVHVLCLGVRSCSSCLQHTDAARTKLRSYNTVSCLSFRFQSETT